MTQKEKRRVLTIHLPRELFKKIDDLEIKNKSKFFNWLLKEYFGELNEGGNRD